MPTIAVAKAKVPTIRAVDRVIKVLSMRPSAEASGD
jgi:hypothetical protein